MDPIYHRRQLADQLVRQLLHPGVLEEGLRSGLFLSGVRRAGKTTFVKMDLIPALQKAGALVIYVDLWTDTTVNPAALTHAAIRDALTALRSSRSNAFRQLKRVKGAEIGAAGFRFGFTLESVGAPGGTTLAKAFLSVVDKAKTDLVFIVDEVQQAITTEDGNQMLLALKAARDAVNQRPATPGRFLFVGTGSHRAMVSELTARRNQAFAGAVSQPFPVLGEDYVRYELARVRQAGGTALPTLKDAADGFANLGHRPEDFRKALRQLALARPSQRETGRLFGVIVQTLRASAADADLRVLEDLGDLACAIFARIAKGADGASGVFSRVAAQKYSDAIGRAVRVEEIQPVVDKMLDANLVMRAGHGLYGVTDPFVREAWLERQVNLAPGSLATRGKTQGLTPYVTRQD